jgi:hypothetical protein
LESLSRAEAELFVLAIVPPGHQLEESAFVFQDWYVITTNVCLFEEFEGRRCTFLPIFTGDGFALMRGLIDLIRAA